MLPAAPLRTEVPCEVVKMPMPMVPVPAALSIVRVPVPILFRLKFALVWLAEPKRPEKVKLVLSKPVARVAAAALLVTKPVPVIEPMTTFVLLISSVPPVARLMLEKRDRLLVLPERSVPLLTWVIPV